MEKFWNFIESEEETVLDLRGPISEETWWGDEVTPLNFKNDLAKVNGDLTVWINSPGGDVFAAVEIYNALKEHSGKVTVKIDALAASAASVIAMAGDEICISPCGMLMIHDPSTVACGNPTDLQHTIDVLNSVKDSIINAYKAKTGLSRNRLSDMMTDETWLDAENAKRNGFVDRILYTDSEKEPEKASNLFSSKFVSEKIINKISAFDKEKLKNLVPEETKKTGRTKEELLKEIKALY